MINGSAILKSANIMVRFGVAEKEEIVYYIIYIFIFWFIILKINGV